MRFLLFMSFILWATSAQAADLTRIERRLSKEPVYQTKPKYCLLVFGSEAKTRVWLVIDGDTLYVDRNGNGDITEKRERVELSKSKRAENSEEESWTRRFTAGKLDQGYDLLVHAHYFDRKMLARLSRKMDEEWKDIIEESRGYLAEVNLLKDGKLQQGGVCAFAERPNDSPILHFDGPLQARLRILIKQELQRGEDGCELHMVVGTPGLGRGSFTCWACDLAPTDAYPIARFEFPNREPGAKPVTWETRLKERC